ncbi:DUF4214 domain-containing protein [Ramlibacter sp. G-1-2-2]|uniref:DUF4214 domain-containing protein n=2 Tax=Ramlibacter agri TaxID=2728837 RepID=A0A848H3J3_9BURK|nr:DUF4214 domain-containing protein [Ramlibacter agri]
MRRLAEGHGKAGVIYDLLRSPEGAKLAADSKEDTSHLGDEAFVDYSYRKLLGRAPDPGGRDYYVSRLKDGAARTWVYQHIDGSDEARERRERGLDFRGDLERLVQQQRRKRGWLARLSPLARLERRLAQIEFAAEQQHCALAGALDSMAGSVARIEQQALTEGMPQPSDAGAARRSSYPFPERSGSLTDSRSPLARTFDPQAR